MTEGSEGRPTGTLVNLNLSSGFFIPLARCRRTLIGAFLLPDFKLDTKRTGIHGLGIYKRLYLTFAKNFFHLITILFRFLILFFTIPQQRPKEKISKKKQNLLKIGTYLIEIFIAILLND